MKRVIKPLGWTMLVGLVLNAALVASLVALVGPLDPTLIEINGEPLLLAELGAGHWWLTVGGVLLALPILLLVLPIVVLVPLLVLALLLVGALLVVAGAVTLLFSPLILALGGVWLIWRLVRGGGARTKAGATMPG